MKINRWNFAALSNFKNASIFCGRFAFKNAACGRRDAFNFCDRAERGDFFFALRSLFAFRILRADFCSAFFAVSPHANFSVNGLFGGGLVNPVGAW